MKTPQLPQHIFQQYTQELEDVRARVLEMGGLVEEQLCKALDALSKGSADIAHYVAAHDFRVNALQVGIDEECTQIIARRQPAASDLRLVLAITKIITDLERVGDEAAKIGRMVLHLVENESPKSYYVGVLSLGHHVRHALNAALDAFARMDSEEAMRIAREDAKVDKEYDAIMRQLITYMMEDPRSITRALHVVWIVRALERIGDHAKNVCESVVYLVEGKDIRHTQHDDESLEEELKSDLP